MKNIKIYSWCSDISNSTGEGILARKFLYHLSKKFNKKIICQSTNKKKIFYYKNKESLKVNTKQNNLSFTQKYILIFKGIYLIWRYHLRGYKTSYVNFLPLWNFLIFFLLPSKTILGPITGTKFIKKDKSLNTFIRAYLFPVFFKLSIFIMFNKWKYFLFSTDLLKDEVPKKKKKYVLFNFQLSRIKKRDLQLKKIDFFIYFRKHANKYDKKIMYFIEKLSKYYSVFVVGDYLNFKNVSNLGYLNKKKIQYYISKSKLTISSSENIYSNFNIDCINNNVKILLLSKPRQKIFKSFNFYQINNKKIYLKEKNLKIFIDELIKRKIFLEKNDYFLHKVNAQIHYYFNSFLK